MTQGVYFVGLDSNRDRYFAKGAVEGDALNLIDNPQQLNLAKFIGTETSLYYFRQLYEVDYNYSYYVSAGTNVFGGFELGNTALSENGIWVTPGIVHRVRIEVKGESGYSGKQILFAVRDYSPDAALSNTTATLTGDWQALTLTFTPGAERVKLRVLKNNDAADYSWSVRKVMVVEGAMPTAYNTGQASDYYEDITTYVQQMSWNNGMDHYDQTVSGGSRATLVLDNRDGYFYANDDSALDIFASNGQFDSWPSATEPQGWSVLSIVDANNITSEAGSDKLHGEGGTGALNLYATTKVLVGLKQVLPTPNQRYRVRFSIGASSGLGGVRFALETANSNVTYISRIYTEPGVYTFFFTAASSGLGDAFCITNNRYPCDVTLEFVEVYAVPRYAGTAKETLISIRAYDGSTEYQMWTGRIETMKPTGGNLAVRTVTVECVDAMDAFNKLEYRPGYVLTDVSVGTELEFLLRQVGLTWPYTKDYWLLGTSFLGVDTWLLGETGLAGQTISDFRIDFATASSSNSEKGISAQAFLRDLMALEIGGRFFVDSRTAQFFMYAHNFDPSITAGTTALSEDDFDAFEMPYADTVINTVTIWYKQKREIDETRILWSSDQDIVVPGKSTKTITGRYFDPTNPAIDVSAASTEPFVRNVDYVISPAPNNPKVQVTVDAGGTSASFKIDNDRQIDITVTTLQIRGDPLYALTEENISVQNADSLINNNIQKRDYNLPLISNSDTAIGIATGLTTMRGASIERLQSITFSATKSSARYTRALSNTLTNQFGTPYTITSNVLKHVGDYIVIGERHSVASGGENTHMVTWILVPRKLFNYWLLGEAGRSELGTTTIPIY